MKYVKFKLGSGVPNFTCKQSTPFYFLNLFRGKWSSNIVQNKMFQGIFCILPEHVPILVNKFMQYSAQLFVHNRYTVFCVDRSEDPWYVNPNFPMELLSSAAIHVFDLILNHQHAKIICNFIIKWLKRIISQKSISQVTIFGKTSVFSY